MSKEHTQKTQKGVGCGQIKTTSVARYMYMDMYVVPPSKGLIPAGTSAEVKIHVCSH